MADDFDASDDEYLAEFRRHSEVGPHAAALGAYLQPAADRIARASAEYDELVAKQQGDVVHAEPVEVLLPFRRMPVDLDADIVPVETLGRYCYRGRLTQIIGEPESGKSWFGADVMRERLELGEHVIYMDEENGLEVTRERLRALGCNPAQVRDQLHYYPFEGRKWNVEDLVALHAMIDDHPLATLAVFDSLPDFLTAAGMSEDSSTDITRFISVVCAPFRTAGIAQMLLDHLNKPNGDKKQQSRYSRGSGAKLAKADVTILVEASQPFDRNTSGRLIVWRTKDRHGRLDIPRLGHAGMALDVLVGDGRVELREVENNVPTACMSALLGLLSPSGWMTTRQLRMACGFRPTTVESALDQLVSDGLVVRRDGPRRSTEYQLLSPEDEVQEQF